MEYASFKWYGWCEGVEWKLGSCACLQTQEWVFDREFGVE